MAKRLKSNNVENTTEDGQMSVDEKILSSDINNSIQATTLPTAHSYHNSVCGSILYSSPTNSPSDIFSILRHGNFDAFRRSFDAYHNDIIRMRNDHGQTVFHILVIQAYSYVWIRLLMMRGCDTCAQDADGYTAAHYAVERDDVEMLKALTLRFHSQARPIPEERINNIHDQCLKALTLKDKQGLTVFMLACHHESLKCLNYLIELNINDCNFEDQFGDTSLHYAVARRNQNLIEKLLDTCKANVNGGNETRPSVLDILQYNREQQKIFERNKDDEIEKYLLSHNAKNRCSIRRVTSKRKGSLDNETVVLPNLACLSLDLPIDGRIETARSHARMASSLESKGDLTGALENYNQAMTYTPDDTLDWATYAFHIALIHMTRGERQLALNLFQKALSIRKHIEKQSEEIDQIQRAIDNIQQQTF